MIDFLIDNAISTEFNINTAGAVMSPIHIACVRGNIGIVTKLLKSGICKVTDVDKYGNTVFHYICTREIVSSEMVEVFSMDKESREMIAKKNLVGNNALHFACKNNAIQILDCLLRCTDIEQMNTALYSMDISCDTPFYSSIAQRRTPVVKYLLNTPELADGMSKALCVQDSYSDSPLQMACQNFMLEYVRLILSSPYLSEKSISAAICLQDRNGDNVLHNYIYRATTWWKSQYYSYKREILAVFEALLQCTGNKIKDEVYVSALCMKNNKLITPLQLAINDKTGELLCSILSLLLKSNLSIASVKTLFSQPLTENGNTLIHLAAEANMLDSVKLLVERQLSDPGILNCENQTSLHLVCQVAKYNFNRSLTALYLCEHGLDVHNMDEYGQSPASYAFCNDKLLLQEMIAKGYCKLTKFVRSLQWHVDYCLLSSSSGYPNLAIKLPLLHLVVFTHGSKSREMMEFLTHQQEFSPDICDSFENTIFHLKAFLYTPLADRMLELCSSDCLNKQNKEGNTPLHIACASGNKNMVKLLIETERCSKSLFKRNIYEHTPLYYVSDRDIVNYLILNGADPKDITHSGSIGYITKTFIMLRGRNPLNPTVTVLVLGNSMAGKTTLIKSLTKAYSWEFIEQPSIGQTKDTHALGEMSGRTAGIEISEYKVFEDNKVRILFYDFAGHPEFESTHSVLLQNLISSSEPTAFLFLIVLDITQDKLTQLMYWAKFIEHSESSYAIGRPEVIIIGSHVDLIPEVESVHKSVKASLCKAMESALLELVENPILLDCRDPKVFELQKVKMLLLRSTKNLIERADLDIRSHLLFAYLYEHFADRPVKLSILQKSLKEQKLTGYDVSELPFTRNTLIDLLKGMHYRQHILLIGLDPCSSETDFWILTAKGRSLMFQNVNGLLFASEEFDRHIRIKSNVGILPSSSLKNEFPDLEYDLLHQFLEYSELCKKITDTEILNLIEGRTIDSIVPTETVDHQLNIDQSTIVSSDNQLSGHIDYFFFPGLVKETRDSCIWKPSKDYSYTTGWLLECTDNSFFNALFLQVLLLRLVFQFATSTLDNKLQRRCIIWKNGVFWSVEGVEMLVEVINQNQAVIVLVRCFEDTELEAVKLRSAVLKEVFKVKAKHCPTTKVIEFVIHNPTFNDRGSLAEPIQKVSMKEIVSSIISGSPRVQNILFQYHLLNRNLLCFEPYVGIGDETLTSLFDIDSANETVSEEVMSHIRDLQIKAGAQSRHTDHIMQLASKPIIYQGLRQLFDMYSVFHGRNPRVRIQACQ